MRIEKKRLREDANFYKNFQYAYHRTAFSNVESIAKQGFRPGYGDLYGSGWYMCYDLDSQLKPRMSGYGEAIIKSEIFPKGVLIFDYNLSKKVYGSNDYSLVSQLLRYSIYRTELHIPFRLKQLSKKLESTFDRPELSAAWFGHVFVGGEDIADAERSLTGLVNRYGSPESFIDSNGMPKLKGMTGAMITGNHDGNVIIVYRHETAIPFQYCITDSSGTITKDWEDIQNAGIAKERADNAQAIFQMFQGRVKNLSTEMSMDEFKSKFNWLLKAKFSNADIEVNSNEEFIWHNGVWEGGDWYGDLWLNGDFKQGKWFRGTFQNGTWHAGNFISGTFGDPAGRCRWVKGSWTGGVFNADYATWHGGKIKVKGVFTPSKTPPNLEESLSDKEYVMDLSEEFLEDFFRKDSGSLEESFTFNSLSDDEKDQLYLEFKKSYEKAVGVAWDRNTFESRAYAWKFFGSVEGGIAVRKQNSGMYKLNATFGSPRKIIEAFKEMQREIGNDPVWGVMTMDLALMLEKLSRKEFKMPPKLFVKTVIPHIAHIFGSEVKSVDPSDGGIIVSTPAGDMKKFFIANKKYYESVLDNAKNNPEKVPVPKSVLNVLIGILKAFI